MSEEVKISREDWDSLKSYLRKCYRSLEIYENAFLNIERHNLDLENYTGRDYKSFANDILIGLKIEYVRLPIEINRKGVTGRVVKWRLVVGR